MDVSCEDSIAGCRASNNRPVSAMPPAVTGHVTASVSSRAEEEARLFAWASRCGREEGMKPASWLLHARTGTFDSSIICCPSFTPPLVRDRRVPAGIGASWKVSATMMSGSEGRDQV